MPSKISKYLAIEYIQQIVNFNLIIFVVTRSAKIAFQNAGYWNDEKVEILRQIDLEKLLLMKIPKRKLNRRQSIHIGGRNDQKPKPILKRTRSFTHIHQANQDKQVENGDGQNNAIEPDSPQTVFGSAASVLDNANNTINVIGGAHASMFSKYFSFHIVLNDIERY